MARYKKKKSLFTRKKASKRKPFLIGIPTDNEWNTFTEYGSFAVDDDETGDCYHFKNGETAFILPEGLLPDQKHHPTDYWIGRIKEIRARNPQDVWARVQWYWSPSDVASVIKSFDVSNCGQYERIFSDYYDYVSSASFCDHATVKRYDESKLDQEAFDDDDFFHRYDLEYRARKIIPNVSRNACTCNMSYNPDRDPIMHFCPRPTCRVAFHQECLLAQTESNTAAGVRQLLECWPDTDKKVTVESLVRRQRGSGYSTSDPLDEFPAEVLMVAQQQILKGVKAGGVVGNVKPVVAARKLIYKTLFEGVPFPTEWMSQIDIDTAIFPQEEGFPVFLCPYCKSPI